MGCDAPRGAVVVADSLRESDNVPMSALECARMKRRAIVKGFPTLIYCIIWSLYCITVKDAGEKSVPGALLGLWLILNLPPG